MLRRVAGFLRGRVFTASLNTRRHAPVETATGDGSGSSISLTRRSEAPTIAPSTDRWLGFRRTPSSPDRAPHTAYSKAVTREHKTPEGIALGKTKFVLHFPCSGGGIPCLASPFH